MTKKVLFLDRDGVINKEKNYLHKIADFEFIDGVFTACQYFQNLGFEIIITTNQSGIGRGMYNESDFLLLNKWMLEEFKKNSIDILEVFYCPHAPNDNCNCRKPKSKMFLDAQHKYNINMQKSIMVGDKEADITASSNAGITQTILVRSGHKIDETSTLAKYILNSIKEVPSIFS